MKQAFTRTVNGVKCHFKPNGNGGYDIYKVGERKPFARAKNGRFEQKRLLWTQLTPSTVGDSDVYDVVILMIIMGVLDDDYAEANTEGVADAGYEASSVEDEENTSPVENDFYAGGMAPVHHDDSSTDRSDSEPTRSSLDSSPTSYESSDTGSSGGGSSDSGD